MPKESVTIQVLELFCKVKLVLPEDLARIHPAFTNKEFAWTFLDRMISAGLFVSCKAPGNVMPYCVHQMGIIHLQQHKEVKLLDEMFETSASRT